MTGKESWFALMTGLIQPHLLLEEGVVQPVLKAEANVQQREFSAAWDSVFCFLMDFPGGICFWNQIAAG